MEVASPGTMLVVNMMAAVVSGRKEPVVNEIKMLPCAVRCSLMEIECVGKLDVNALATCCIVPRLFTVTVCACAFGTGSEPLSVTRDANTPEGTEDRNAGGGGPVGCGPSG